MSERLRFNTAQAADFAVCHPQTIRKALEAGELHGGQRKAKGRWSVRRDCLEAWAEGAECEHQREEGAA